MKKVLIVGAGGFIGGFLAAESLSRGYETWCGVRASTSRRYLTDPALKFLELDFDNPTAIAGALKDAIPDGEKWDWIVYNLGATKCTNFLDFNRINFEYLRRFVEALEQTGMMPDKLIYMSSLSALGPGDEKNYTPLSSTTVPNPNTRYGLSKIKAETFLATRPGVPWIVFRPTGVYGPHEQDYLMMIKCIDRHFDFGVGYRKQLLTFIYVSDLARAVFDALEKAPLRQSYIISESRSYTQKEFRSIVARELGRRFVVAVKLPLWAVKGVSVIAEKIGKLRMKPSTLNSDKYKIMKQRNWACDVSDARRDFGFEAGVDLPTGIRNVVAAWRLERKEGEE